MQMYDELCIFYDDFMMIDYAILSWLWNNNLVWNYYVIVNECCLRLLWALNVVVVMLH